MNASVFVLSAAVLAHEICLLRVLSLASWHHAASLVVAVALLGFGVSGTVLALVPRLLREGTVAWCAALYAVLIPASLAAARGVDFNALEVGWNPTQWLRLLALEALFFLPFLVAALGIGAALAVRRERPGPTYAANLAGSGAGAILVPLALLLGPPAQVLRAVAALAALAAVPRRPLPGLAVAAAVVLLPAQDLGMSPFKDLPAAPNKRILETRYGPMGRVDLVAVPSLHHAPGLSLMAPALPADQDALFVDGHFVAALDRGDTAYLDHCVDALPFIVLGRQRTVLLGVGPGLARASLVVDPNRDLLALAGVPGVAKEPRAWLEGAWEPDGHLLLHGVPPMHAAAETPLLTVEGMQAAHDRAPAVAFQCAIETPPRTALKLLATAERVTPHVVAVRSADRLSALLLREEPGEDARTRVLEWCRAEGFDPVRPSAWRFERPFHETDIPLDPPGADYPYDVRPVTDARPYFFKFFRWSRLPGVFDREQTAFVQWPFVALAVAFLQVTALGLLLMAAPLLVSRAARAPAALFLALGLGFMLLEMAFLQRAMMLLGSPVGAAAAVIGGFLAGAGLGSLVQERWERPLRPAALAVLVLAPAGYVAFPSGSVPAAFLLCAAVAFPMGVPFPSALKRLPQASVPWALAWNGCASVAAAAAAPLLSATWGIPLTGGLALLCYLFVLAKGVR